MKRIFVAVDASARGKLVLSSAAALASATGAKLCLFRAVTVPPEIPVEAYLRSGADLQAMLVEGATKELEALAATIPAAVIDKLEVDVAIPWDGICRAARAYDADLIIVGSHGYGLIDRVLGTTAAKVVNHADRSVLVVRNVGDKSAG